MRRLWRRLAHGELRGPLGASARSGLLQRCCGGADASAGPANTLQVSYESEAEELELESSVEYRAALGTAGVTGYHLGAPAEGPAGR